MTRAAFTSVVGPDAKLIQDDNGEIDPAFYIDYKTNRRTHVAARKKKNKNPEESK